MQSAPADKQYFYHYHILSFLCSKIMLCKRCKQGVKQAFLTQKTAYLSHSWCYSQILPWQMKSTRIIKISYHKMPCNAEFCVGLSAFYGIVFFLFITTLFAKYFKMVQFKAMCSSQIVVS